MRYKIGDKIRIVNFPEPKLNGLIGEVDEEKNGRYACRIIIRQEGEWKGWNCHMLEKEIEPLVKSGEQLVFSFMRDKQW